MVSILLDKCKVGMVPEVLKILRRTCLEAIHPNDYLALCKEVICKVGSEEPRSLSVLAQTFLLVDVPYPSDEDFQLVVVIRHIT